MELIEKMFPSVLQIILGNLDTPDLPRCRLVNKAWNKEACRLLKAWREIQIDSLDQLEQYCDIFETGNGNVSLVLHSISFRNPYSYYPGIDELQRLRGGLQRLQVVSGSSITWLRVSFDWINGISSRDLYRELHEMIYQKFPNVEYLSVFPSATQHPNLDEAICNLSPTELPNLRKLELSLFAIEGESPEDRDGADIFIKNVLKSAVNLRRFKSKGSFRRSPSVIRRMTTYIPIISSSLESLHLGLTLYDESAEALIQRSFPKLANLHLQLHPSWVSNSNVLKKVLRKYSCTLRQLTINFNHIDPVMFMEEVLPPGVILRELEELHMQTYRGDPIGWGSMPKLRKLCLKTCHNVTLLLSTLPTVEMQSSLCSLTHIEVGSYSGYEELTFPVGDPAWLTKLTTLCLQELMLPRLTFTAIIRQCGALRDLTLQNCGGVDDEALCGIKAKLIKLISPVKNLKTEREDNEDAINLMITMAKAVPKTDPWIGNLTSLRCLTLMYTSWITDTGILFGVVQCEKLTRLRCTGCGFLTWRAIQIIKQGLVDLVAMEVTR